QNHLPNKIVFASSGSAYPHHGIIVLCGHYLSGMRAWSQSPMREAEGLSRLHNTITDWPDSGYTRRIAFIPGAAPPLPVVLNTIALTLTAVLPPPVVSFRSARYP